MANKENETEGEVATPNIVDDPVFRQEYDKALNQWNLEQETTKRQSEAFAVLALKSPGFAAAGGIAAMLGFYSANYDHLQGIQEKLDAFNCGLTLWGFALFVSVIAPGLAFLSQQFYLHSFWTMDYSHNRKGFSESDHSKRYECIGNAMRYLAIAVVIGSYILLLIGGYYFWKLTS